MSEDQSSIRDRSMKKEEDVSQVVKTKPESVSESMTSEATAYLNSMTPKWRNWWIRGIFTFVMIGFFAVFIYLGPLALAVLIIAIFMKCFQEIIKIGLSKYQEHNLPLYRVLNWFFFFVFILYIVGHNLIHYHPEFFSEGIPDLFATYHRLVSFSLYIFGFVMFVLTLQKDYYGIQFTLFGWTHITLFFLGSQVYLAIQNIYEGLFWFLLPVSMVICNDIMAYFFGFFFGRTKLINLSPKKTWEGFLGAFGSTIIWGLLFSYVLARFDLACYSTQLACENSPMFKIKDYIIPIIGIHISIYPVMIHALSLSIFASLIAPFGGFFASGFKRAFKIKDFSDAIPGHGGLMDRVDCQFLMISFANVYYFTFCRAPNIDRIVSLIFSLTADQQLEIFHKLQDKIKIVKSTTT